MESVPRLNIIGCGAVGRTLGRLWAAKNSFIIGDILTRSVESAAHGAAFIGSGRAVKNMADMRGADVFMIGTPDRAVAEAGGALASSGVVRPGNVVFHLSGALSSGHLHALREKGAWTAAVHPVKSFADPARSSDTFSGTFCGMEGDAAALELLRSRFETIGGRTFAIEPGKKSLYHAGTVIACNYLTALIELSAQVLEEAGVERMTAMQFLAPLVRGTVDNVFAAGTAAALTGPIARGDYLVVGEELDALRTWSKAHGDLYRLLGRTALELARTKGSASKAALSLTEQALGRE